MSRHLRAIPGWGGGLPPQTEHSIKLAARDISYLSDLLDAWANETPDPHQSARLRKIGLRFKGIVGSLRTRGILK